MTMWQPDTISSVSSSGVFKSSPLMLSVIVTSPVATIMPGMSVGMSAGSVAVWMAAMSDGCAHFTTAGSLEQAPSARFARGNPCNVRALSGATLGRGAISQ